MNDFKFVYVTGLNLNLGGISHTWIMKIKTKLKSKGAFLLSSVVFFFSNVLLKSKGVVEPCQTSKIKGLTTPLKVTVNCNPTGSQSPCSGFQLEGKVFRGAVMRN